MKILMLKKLRNILKETSWVNIEEGLKLISLDLSGGHHVICPGCLSLCSSYRIFFLLFTSKFLILCSAVCSKMLFIFRVEYMYVLADVY